MPLHGFYLKNMLLLTHRREKFRTFHYIRAYYEKKKIYKDNFITKDKVAEILGTNLYLFITYHQ